MADFSESTKTIPTQIKSETMLGKGIFLTDIVVIFAFWLIMDNFKDFVHPLLQIIYTIFTVIVGFVVTRKTKSNPGKRALNKMIFYFAKDRKTYHRREDAPDPVQIEYDKNDRLKDLMEQHNG